MIAYFGTMDENLDFNIIDWKTSYCISKSVFTVTEARDNNYPRGMVVEIDMNDDDVVSAVSVSVHGDSYPVRMKIISIVSPPLEREAA